MDATANQSFASSDPLPSPLGFEVAAGALQVVGPLGLHLSYRRVSEEGRAVANPPGCIGCANEQVGVRTNTMTTLGLGVSYDFVNPTGVFLTLALTGGSNWQDERREFDGMSPASTGYRIGSHRSLGASAHLRLRPVLAGVHPSFAVRYDRIWGGGCAASWTCMPARNLAVSGGLSWMLGGDVRPLGR